MTQSMSSCRVIQELVFQALSAVRAAETEALKLPTDVDSKAVEHLTSEFTRATAGLRGAFYTLSTFERSMRGEL